MQTQLKDWLSALDALLLKLSGEPLTTSVLLDALTQFCVDELGAAFARIWLPDETGAVLVLKSSRGQYTALNGTRSRIPVGQGSKIDRIFTEGAAHITNDVLNDPGVKDKDWARREGLVAFAGYRLGWANEGLGVLGMYSREPFSQDLLLVLGVFAVLTSAIIYQTNQTERNMAQFCEVTGIKRALLDRLIVLGGNGHSKPVTRAA